MTSPVPSGNKDWLFTRFRRIVVDENASKDKYTLARGKHGKICKGQRMSDGALVAIKSERSCPRVEYEQKIHASLSSQANILPIIAIAHSDTKSYTVTPLGQTLPSGPLELKFAQHVMKCLLNALEQLHALGIYHRDVKRKNIIMYNNEACLIDFGKSAKAVSHSTARIYARSDCRKAAKVFGKLLAQTPHTRQRMMFEVWWRTSANLSVSVLRTFSLLTQQESDSQQSHRKASNFHPANHMFFCFPMLSCMILEGVTAHNQSHLKILSSRKV